MSIKRKIFLVENNSHHGILENCVEFFKEFEVVAIDFRSTISVSLLYESIKKHPEQIFAIISVIDFAFRFKLEDRFIHEITEIPIVMIACDSPADFRRSNVNKLAFDLSRIIVAAPCKEWELLWKRFFKPAYSCFIDGSFMAPKLRTPIGDESYTWSSRASWGVFPAHFIHYSSDNSPLNSAGILNLISSFGEAYTESFSKILNDVKLNDSIELMAHIDSELSNNLQFQDIDSILTFYYYINSYMKLTRREALAEALLDLAVLFLGDGYPEAWKNKFPDKFGSIHGRDLAGVFYQGRIIIDPPQICDTIHDRMVYGIRCGLAPVTKKNKSLERWFRHGENVIFYENPQSAAIYIKEALENPAFTYSIWKNACETIMENQIAQNCMATIYGVIAEVRRERCLP